MAELKNKLVTLEDLKMVYDDLRGRFGLPDYTSAQNGCVLGIQEGRVAWIAIENANISVVDKDSLGAISNNTISLNDGLEVGTYTLYYEDENNEKLTDWKEIGTVEVNA